MRHHLLVAVLALFTGLACGNAEEQTQPSPPATPPAPPPPPDPTLLPAVAPEPSPSQGEDGYTIHLEEIEGRPRLTVRNDGQATFEGDIVFHLVWIGPPSGADPPQWHAVGAINGCTGTVVPTPLHTWRGAMTPGWTTTWDVPPDRATFCREGAIDGMDQPAGRYRVSAAFRRRDGTTERTLWSQVFRRS